MFAAAIARNRQRAQIRQGAMKISGPGGVSKPSVKKTKGRSGGDGGDFASKVAASQTSAAEASHGAFGASGAGPVTAVDALIGLQEVPDAAAHPSKGVALGHDLLDRLDDIRRGLLLGTISVSQLESLARLLQDRPPAFQDPELSSILDDIELRARVELAKLERR